MNVNRYALRLALTATLLTSTVGVAPGATVFFNTDTGVLQVNGLAATTLNGTAVESSVLNTPAGQVMPFRFLGNLLLNSTDQVTAGGSTPASPASTSASITRPYWPAGIAGTSKAA